MESIAPFRLYLASQSPRRAELLEQIGVSFQRLSVEVDETPLAGELPADYVSRVACEKSRAGWELIEGRGVIHRPVLGADTAVIFDRQIMGKPLDQADAERMLQTLSGQTHQVMTALCFCYQGQEWTSLSVTEVAFRPISTSEIREYWLSGEPRDKAGAYAIQGLGAVFVESIKGSYSAVVGLPLLEVNQLLKTIETQ